MVDKKKPKYETLIEDMEHTVLLSAFGYYKMTKEYLEDQEIQKLISDIENKIERAVKVAKAKQKYYEEPNKYSDWTFETFMDAVKDKPAPEGAKKVKLSKNEQQFAKIMMENCVVATMMFQIEPKKMLDILNIIAKAYKKSIEEGDFK